MRAVESTETSDKRASALARGFAKLCEIEIVEGTPNSVRFACGTRHDEMIAALMYRAQNVRASMREQEEAAGRGQLAPPSQQK